MDFPTIVSDLYPTKGTRIPVCSRPLKEGIKFSSIIFEADSGHSQRRVKSAPKKTFDLTWAALTQDQYFTLRDFFLKVLNIYAFWYTHPIEKTRYYVRVNQDTFSATNVSQGIGNSGAIYSLQLSLVQEWL